MTCRKCKREIPAGSRFCNLCGAEQEPPERRTKKRGNGQGTVYRRGESWEACATRYEGGRRITKKKGGFTRKKDALDWLSTVRFIADKPSITFSELYNEWSQIYYPNISKMRASIYEGAYRKCLDLHNKKWSDISLRHMQAIVNKQKETYYPRRDLKILFSLMTKYAIISGYSDKDLTSNIRLPPKEKPRKEAFSDEEIRSLWNDYNAGNEFAGAILLMIYTGMRYGELTTVQPQNVFIEESYLIGGIKTEAGKTGDILLIDAIKPIAQSLLVDGKLEKMSNTTFRKHFNKTLARCGCRPHTIHECRHTTATVLAKAGVQAAIISEIMRHTSYSQTLEYTHIDRDTKLKAITTALRPNME